MKIYTIALRIPPAHSNGVLCLLGNARERSGGALGQCLGGLRGDPRGSFGGPEGFSARFLDVLWCSMGALKNIKKWTC